MGPLGCPEHPIWRPRRRLGRLQCEIEAVEIGRRSMRHLPFFAWFSPARMYLCVGRLVHTRYTPTVHLSAHLPCTAPPKQRGAPVKIPEIVYWVSPNKLFQPSTSIFLLSPGALWSWPRGHGNHRETMVPARTTGEEHAFSHSIACGRGSRVGARLCYVRTCAHISIFTRSPIVFVLGLWAFPLAPNRG